MTIIGVNTAIFQDQRLLLARREDFEIWCLPGGKVEPGESIAQAAAREAWEETGLEVRLTRFVGVYSRPGIGRFVGHIFVFAAEPSGGKLCLQPGETIDLRFFERNHLPVDLMVSHRLHIEHAWDGAGGSVAWNQDQRWLFEPGLTRAGLYSLRDRSGLSSVQFYNEYLGKSGKQGDLREVPPQSWPLPYQGPVSGRTPGDDPEESDENDAALPEIAANVAVIQDGKILLVEREDFRVWCIPGGMVDPGETLAQAARRELWEETGLEVALDRLVGVYSEPERFHRGIHIVLFAGHIKSGTLHLQPDEILRSGFFGRDELPRDLLYGHRQRILDALDGVGGGVAWTQATPWPFQAETSRAQIYTLRDQSGLSRAGFYRLNFRLPISGEEINELTML